MATQYKAFTWIGWILTILIGGMLCFSAVAKMIYPPGFGEQWVDKLKYPEHLALAIGIVELCCAIVYLIPRTAILGAVLITGYLGGAIATHVRIEDDFSGGAIGGVLVWLAVYLRDARVRALLPLRNAQDTTNT